MDIPYLIFVFAIAVFSMVLHELAHGFVAYKLGDDTAKNDGRLSLNPLKHIDPVMTIAVPLVLAMARMPVFGGAKPVPIDSRKIKWGEWGFALVAIAGPLMNFVLAFVFFLIFHFTGAGGVWGQFLASGIQVNLGFCLFNILPIPPLDGSRVLYVLAPRGVQNLMWGMERYGVLVVYGLLLLCGGLFSSYMMNATVRILHFFEWIVGA